MSAAGADPIIAAARWLYQRPGLPDAVAAMQVEFGLSREDAEEALTHAEAAACRSWPRRRASEIDAVASLEMGAG